MSTFREDVRGIRRALNLLVAVVVIACLYFGRDFFLPVALAILLALVLRPVSRALKRMGVPTLIGAALIVLTLAGLLGAAFYFAAGPAQKWIEEAPRIGYEIRFKFQGLIQSATAIGEVGDQIEDIAQPGNEEQAQEVVMREPGLLSRAETGGLDLVAGALLCAVLMYFLLATADGLLEKLARSLPHFGDKVRALRIAREIEIEVSRYLFTVTLVNIALGAAIAFGLWQVGMPNPLLWGGMATLLNFIPYVGSIIGAATMFAISAVTFGAPMDIALPPLIYLAFTALEGQFITPMILGRRLDLNPAAVFLSVAFWGWRGGAAGAVAAVPMLLIVKIVIDRFDDMPVAKALLSASRRNEETPDTAKAAKAHVAAD